LTTAPLPSVITFTRVLSIAQGALTVMVGFSPNLGFFTVMSPRLLDGLIVELGVALGDAEGEVEADGVASVGEAEGVADEPHAARINSVAAQATACAARDTAKGTPRL
jgi:hypothetical protein